MDVDYESDDTKNVKTQNIDNPHDFNLAIAYANMNEGMEVTVTPKLFRYLCKEVGETPELMYKGVLVKIHG